MSVRRQGAIINFRVHPAVKAAWDELDQKTKSFLVRKFQMEVLGLKDSEVPEEVKAHIKLEYDERSLQLLKEILLLTDEEMRKKEEKMKEELEKLEKEVSELKAWIKEAKKFLKRFVDAYTVALCEYLSILS